jgi:hypothetical protein
MRKRKAMKNMKRCPVHGLYPSRFDSCPECNPSAKSAPVQPLPLEEHMARMTDKQVEYIWQSMWFEQGTDEAKRACLTEYDKRFGLENWPEHIDKEVM